MAAYRDNNELLKLRDHFYRGGDVRSAIDKVHVLRTRGQLPHAVEATASLMEISIADNNGLDRHILQSSYCSALVRFVNGFLDPFQKASVALPLVKLAKEINLPVSLVEIRHMATHEEIPSLSLCRKLTAEALQWLQERYWDQLPNGKCLVPEKVSSHDDISIERLLRAYKQARKRGNHADWVLERLSNVINGSKYCAKTVWCLLFDNHVIYGEEKCIANSSRMTRFPQLVDLYDPLLRRFSEGTNGGFLVIFLFSLIHHSSAYSSRTFQPQEKTQAERWVLVLVEKIKNHGFPISTTRQNFPTENEWKIAVFTNLSLLPHHDSMYIAVESAVKDSSSSEKSFLLPPPLEDLLTEPETTPKRRKIMKSPPESENSMVKTPFPKKTHWNPLPFGNRINR